MLLHITHDYNGLPNALDLKFSEIRFFYNGIRQNLKEAQTAKKEG